MALITTERGLLAPVASRGIDPASRLAAGLCSLWVPGVGNADNGLKNLAPDFLGTMEYGGAATNPSYTSTDFGIALRFDGSNDYMVRRAPVPFQPHVNPANTWGIVCQINALPVLPAVGNIYSFTNNIYVNGRQSINIKSGRTRFYYTGDNGTTSTFVDINETPAVGEVVFISAVMESLASVSISFWEPNTNRFLSASKTNNTTTQAAAQTWILQNESLGSRFYNGFRDVFANVSILDAWFWNRAFDESELDLWRKNRWSVLQPARTRTAYPYTTSASSDSEVFLSTNILLAGIGSTVPSSIVPGFTFSRSSSFINGTTTPVKSAIGNGVVFTRQAEISFQGSRSYREDFYFSLREDNSFLLKENNSLVDATKFDVAVDPFIATSSFLTGDISSIQSVELGGVILIQNYSILFEGILGQNNINSPFANLQAVSKLELYGPRHLREDGGLTIHESGLYVRKELNEFVFVRDNTLVSGINQTNQISLIAGTPQDQKQSLVAPSSFVASSEVTFGVSSLSFNASVFAVSSQFIAGSPSLSLDPSVFNQTSTLISGSVNGQIVRGVAGQILTNQNDLLLSSPIININYTPVNVNVSGTIFNQTRVVIAGQVSLTTVGSAAGISQTKSITLLSGAVIGQRNTVATGTVQAQQALLTPGQPVAMRQASVASAQFAAVRSLISGTPRAILVSAAQGIDTTSVATFSAGVAQARTNARPNSIVFNAVRSFTVGNAVAIRSATTPQRTLLDTISIIAGGAVGTLSKAPLPKAYIQISVRSAVDVGLTVN